jgi:hypothetical protein
MLQPTRMPRFIALACGLGLVRLIGALALIAVGSAASAIERVAIHAGTGNHVAVVGADVGWGESKRGSLGQDWSWSL